MSKLNMSFIKRKEIVNVRAFLSNQRTAFIKLHYCGERSVSIRFFIYFWMLNCITKWCILHVDIKAFVTMLQTIISAINFNRRSGTIISCGLAVNCQKIQCSRLQSTIRSASSYYSIKTYNVFYVRLISSQNETSSNRLSFHTMNSKL